MSVKSENKKNPPTEAKENLWSEKYQSIVLPICFNASPLDSPLVLKFYLHAGTTVHPVGKGNTGGDQLVRKERVLTRIEEVLRHKIWLRTLCLQCFLLKFTRT